MCHTFDKCGVYYFGDIAGKECASYIGIIAVKQKSEQYVFSYSDESKRFEQEIVTLETGDYAWWKWSKATEITMRLCDASLMFDRRFDTDARCDVSNACAQLEANGLAKSGIYAYRFKRPGCYYFIVNNGKSETIMTIVATSVQKVDSFD